MYKKSKDVTMHKVFPRNTRNSMHIVFKTDGYQGGLNKHSPNFVGTTLWDALLREIIEMPDIYSFEKRVTGLNCRYIDLLV